MRATPIILLVLIVCLPMALLVWLGNRMATDEQTVIRQQFRSLLTNQLRDIDQIVSGHFTAMQGRLRTISKLDSVTPGIIRARLRSAPLVRQFLVYSPDGDILYPNPRLTMNSSEQEFFLQAADLISDRDIFYAAGGKRRSTDSVNTQRTGSRFQEPVPATGQTSRGVSGIRLESATGVQTSDDQEAATLSPSAAPTEGWHIWFWGRGVHLFYWQRLDSGHVVCLLVERSRWMADLIATLPQTVNTRPADTNVSRPNPGSEPRPVPVAQAVAGESPRYASELTASRIRLLDSAGHPIYQWGSHEPAQT
ncbi:MAG: hypothetical protein VB858_04260, partial [Planctomycetaceae bacterium]